MIRRIFIAAIGLVICTAIVVHAEPFEGNTTIESVNKAQYLLERKIYLNHPLTFYCGSRFAASKKISNHKNYIPVKDSKRANRIEWEHIVPVSLFGRSFDEWREGHPECLNSKGKPYYGRSCARKTSIQFRHMESDMYNLVPVIGELKALRSNYGYAMIPGETRAFGECDLEIENRKVEPPEDIRGDIARTYFYMDAAYPDRGIISKKNKEMFDAWNQEDPVSYWECKRAKKIERQQRNENPFVKWACKEKSRW